MVENQRGEPGFVLRVNPDAFVSSMATAGKRWPKKILWWPSCACSISVVPRCHKSPTKGLNVLAKIAVL